MGFYQALKARVDCKDLIENWQWIFDSQNFDLILQQATSMISNRYVHKACKNFKMLIKQLDVNYISQGLLVTTPCVQCGKALSYPCYKSLLQPMSKEKFVFLKRCCFPTKGKLSTSPLTFVHTTFLDHGMIELSLSGSLRTLQNSLYCTINSLLLAVLADSWR